MELIHINLSGPHPQGYDGLQYLMVVIDDFTRFINVYLLKDRSQALFALKKYRQEMESRIGKKLRAIRSDQARELQSKEFNDYLMNNQIRREKSTAHLSQQNGIAERAIQEINKIARKNMIAASAPKKYWPEAVRIAGHQVNMTPHSKHPNTTPYNMMLDRSPDLQRLHIFGAVTYFWQHQTQRQSSDQWEPRAKQGVFLGFAQEMKAYRILDVERNIIVEISCARIFDSQMYWKNDNKSQQNDDDSKDDDEWNWTDNVNMSDHISPFDISIEGDSEDDTTHSESEEEEEIKTNIKIEQPEHQQENESTQRIST